jgi:hypothetical protein
LGFNLVELRLFFRSQFTAILFSGSLFGKIRAQQRDCVAQLFSIFDHLAVLRIG